MVRTADRFPGEREDEGIILDDQGPGGLNNGDPAVRGVRYVTDRFKLQDALGIFNARAVYVSAASDPTVSSDNANGFSVGTWWLNDTTGDVFICKDNSNGAAVWLNPTTGLPAADAVGQHLISLDGSTFSKALPVVSPDDGWLSNCLGELLVEGLEP